MADVWHSQPREGDTLARRLRLESGLSQRDVARRAGVTLGVVQRAEAGQRLTPANAKAIADFWGMEVGDVQELLP